MQCQMNAKCFINELMHNKCLTVSHVSKTVTSNDYSNIVTKEKTTINIEFFTGALKQVGDRLYLRWCCLFLYTGMDPCTLKS